MRLDPSVMETKKPYPNQPVLIHDPSEMGSAAGNVLHGPCTLPAVKTAQLRQQKPTNMIHGQSPVSQPQFTPNRAWEPLIQQNNQLKKKPASNQQPNHNQQLRFPSTKRPPEAAVTMQGWLHKQGSDGLKVWRKRWFVLSNYCLFYYKGPEEEKVLGSILLPSYKVSICPPDSKLGKKFAFKCEHANMRTYYLAADSHEIMQEWVEALSMACMLQSSNDVSPAVDRQSGPSISSVYNQSLETSDSGFHQYQGHQPLYANAPPKPRRQNDGYSSPGHEIGYNTPPSSNNTTLSYHLQSQLQPHHYHPHHHHHLSGGTPVYQSYQSPHRPHAHCPPDGVPIPQSSERRTPDTYGRSKLTSGMRSGREASDYEDIYSQEEVMYKRPLSPVAYSNIKKISPVATIPIQQRPYALFSSPGPQIHTHRNGTRQLPNVVPRPHSADFLEFEMKQTANNLQQQPRPKSSLDISQPTSYTPPDSYYYSKESYAEKMRKSSLYVQQPRWCPPMGRSNTLGQMPSSGMDDPRLPQPDICRMYRIDSRNDKRFGRENEEDHYGSNWRHEHTPNTTGRDGERRREESMRRLLEWKQRMLQSPLNRKVPASISMHHGIGNAVGYRQHPHQHQRTTLTHPYQRYRYGSYSSDDEENVVDRSRKEKGTIRNKLLQAGRTNKESQLVDKFLVTPSPVLDDSTDESTRAELTASQLPILEPPSATPTSIATPTTIISPSEEPQQTPTSSPEIVEENYLPMTPKKSILDPSYTDKLPIDSEENAYMEMSRGHGTVALLDPKRSPIPSPELHPYEIFSFTEGKIEPVYMEVSSSSETQISGTQTIVPNTSVINSEQETEPEKEPPEIIPESRVLDTSTQLDKSDSSDADDEASKDLDSLDTPFHPRFSLSDTFRPASYYLGASQVFTEFHDSSDSELVSPPPIPTSPQLTDLDLELNGSFYRHQQNNDYYAMLNVSDQDTVSNNDNTTPATPLGYLSADNLKQQDVRESPFIPFQTNSDSDVEIRHPTSYYERMMKRRPVSDEFYDELESLDSALRKTPVDVDQYLKVLEIKDTERSLNVSKRTDDYGSDYIQRQSVDASSDLTLSGEILGLCTSSVGSTINGGSPLGRLEGNRNSAPIPLSTPYYCSDLMNNQRQAIREGKKDIMRIVNPIRMDLKTDNTYKLAAEARSVSVDFLNLADKTGQIDKKNLYESDTLKRMKAESAVRSENVCEKNMDESSKGAVRRTHSLSGLLDGDNEKVERPVAEPQSESFSAVDESARVWEEDGLWRDRLRIVSQRHTRSLDGLDDIGNEPVVEPKPVRHKRKLTRDVTYVNDNVIHLASIRNQKEASENSESNKSGNFLIDRETLRQWDLLSSAPSDSGPASASSAATSTVAAASSGTVTATATTATASSTPTNQDSVVDDCRTQERVGVDNKELRMPVHESRNQDTSASGSISLANHETFPRDVNKRNTPSTPQGSSNGQPQHYGYFTMPHSASRDSDFFIADAQHHMHQQPHQMPPNLTRSHYDVNDVGQYNLARKGNGGVPNGRQLDDVNAGSMSAGELLGRTHEELVLLLIQLRRQSTNSCHAIEACYRQIDNIQQQLQLGTMDAQRRLENLKKLEQLKQHLLELEKQYEKGKPLVNLVDNMVKLGSLYRGGPAADRLEFNQLQQEKRLLAEERRDWNRLSPNHLKLQAKVQQLYQLDRLLHEESETLHVLQQDKEKIERALGSLRCRLNVSAPADPRELEHARRQQLLLENELSKVHRMLAHNSRKLEETVAGNARLEQELLVLRQKLQESREPRIGTRSPQPHRLGPTDGLPCAAGLEAELHRVQQLVGDLQRQRHELSLQVKHLTDRSRTLTQLTQQAGHTRTLSPSLTGERPQGSQAKSRTRGAHLSWRETDLDTMQTIDHGADRSRPTTPTPSTSASLTQYQNPEQIHHEYNHTYYSTSPGHEIPYRSAAPPPPPLPIEDHQLNFNLQEKQQEIKTVRIVKRESERRQRDREKTTPGNYGTMPEHNRWDSLLEEADQNYDEHNPYVELDRRQYGWPAGGNDNGLLNRDVSISSPSLPLQTKPYQNITTSTGNVHLDKSPVLSPVFKSKAARQIINEMSGATSLSTSNNSNLSESSNNTQQLSPETTVKCSVRRLIPKEKRRHYTAPHNTLPNMSTRSSGLSGDGRGDDIWGIAGVEAGRRRARDDLDMERALRHRTDTPDVVRSTLSSKELKYTEDTIENLLGTPDKITIPERYIPEKLPQLSPEEQQHRLRKVESIKKMLSDTTILRGIPAPSKSTEQNSTTPATGQEEPPKVSTSKIVEEKRQREHLLQLNQILAKQVMEMSKIVAVKALATLPFETKKNTVEEDDLSPVTPLPLYQQRENFYS